MQQPIQRVGGVRLCVSAIAMMGLVWGASGYAQVATAQETHRATGTNQKESFPVNTMPVQDARKIAGPYLQQMIELGEEALAASRAAEQASSIEGIKTGAADVFATVWGSAYDPAQSDPSEALPMPGWKERWQVTGAEFDSAFVARLGAEPPKITDPTELGIVGRGRALRTGLNAIINDAKTSDAERERAQRILASVNNVIGYMEMHNGVTKGELQPRVDLTREWTSPPEFWNSTADTGWLFEAFSQAANILKTNYDGDVAMAKRHASDMTQLIEKYLNGLDADKDGTIEPVKMEGGLYAAMKEAQAAGLASR